MRVAISGSPRGRKTLAIQRRDRIERITLDCFVDARRVGEVQHRIANAAKLDSLVDRRQKTAAPIAVPTAGTLGSRTENNKPGQVLGLASEAIERPRPQAGFPEQLRSGVHHDLGRRMIERVGDHRLHDRDVIDHLGGVRKQLRQLRAALAMLREGVFRAEQFRVGVDECCSIALQQFRRRQGPVELGQLRFKIKHLQVTGGAGHEQENDVLRLGRKMRLLGSKQALGLGITTKQVRRSHRSQSDSAILEEPAACDLIHGGSFAEVAAERIRARRGENATHSIFAGAVERNDPHRCTSHLFPQRGEVTA